MPIAETKETIAVYGGSFDPPHVAHVLVAAWALAATPVTRVLMVPTFAHAFGKRSVSFEHRAAMCTLAMANLRAVEVCDIELRLQKSRTFHTLKALRVLHPHADFRLLMGADLLADSHRWFRWDDVIQMAPPLVIGRQGLEGLEGLEGSLDSESSDFPLTLPAISSTDIRARLAENRSVSGLLSPKVTAYIKEHGLYGARI